MMFSTIFQFLFLNVLLLAAPSSGIEQSLTFQFMGEKSVNKGDCEQGCIRVEADKFLIRGNHSGNRYIEIYVGAPAAVGEYKISSKNRIELGRGRNFENKTFESVAYTCHGCDASYPAGSIKITRFDGPGGYIEGSFTTMLSEKGVWKEQFPIEGTFKVYRER